MKDVYIVGIGSTPVTRGEAHSPAALGAEAVQAALRDGDIEPADIAAVYVGNMASGILSHQTQLGALVAELSGLAGREAMAVEAACASGSAALRAGYTAVAGGMHKAVVVCGTEQLAHADKSAATRALATAADYDHEGRNNETFVSLNATFMQLYLERYKLQPSALSGFAITAHENAMNNPNALFHKRITHDDFEQSRMVHDPLRLFDVSPICDGAAAVVLADRQVAEHLSRNGAQVRVAASSIATMPLALTKRADPLDLSAVRESTESALRQAGIERRHLGLAELHDAYTIMTTLSLEASGFADAGQGWRLADPERTGLHGDLPISTFGGLKARGHPVGATGIYQIVESVLQLRGEAGENQVPNAEFVLAQNIGGTASTVLNHILQRIA